ncbi:hypothetical protein OBBRIDRAFT_836927 [Obba rivulosa]|uniref:CxC2-like cysteine cluster KDZ transposase-associated domain-containing protein n=1 Tax=Obba rivulosa TaxID=1052685 RepID=A0A8E2DHC4_9APHY|nr:hypothetical protein OBBRIDRAFT_836927 [Obba rivulosa]
MSNMNRARLQEAPTRVPQRSSVPRSGRLAEFVARWASHALGAWLSLKNPPALESCQRCATKVLTPRGPGGPATGEITDKLACHCTECFTAPLLCSDCIVAEHNRNPFHRVQVWDVARGFWRRESLGKLGLTLNLGHLGVKCPIAFNKPRHMMLVHSHGIEELGVQFYVCLNDKLKGTPDALQLISHGMWPGSWEKPMTAFTIEVLKDFHLLSLQSQMSAQEFFRYLQWQTDNI